MSTPLFQPKNRGPRLAEAAVERARLTVVPRRATVAPRVPFVSLVSVLLIGGIAGLLLFNTNMQQASFVASSMEERAAVLAGKEESLRMQLHRLRDPQHVAARAKQLGMVPSSSPAFIRLSDGKVLGRPAVAEPGNGIRIAPLPPAKPRPELVIAEVPRSVLAAAARDARARSRAADRRARAADRRDTAGASADTSRDRGAAQRTKNKENGQTGERTP
ncbi:MAG TPA: hypothetical protein VFR87_15510 [Nocardioidaceae bacterium]|nr:hypothetical protein [Nocardioidaceae bacterium]